MPSASEASPPLGPVPSVSELTRAIRELLEPEFAGVWVRGEVSNLRVQASGHVYFTLKDAGSQLACVLFRGDAARQSVRLRDGQQLVLGGRLSVYEPQGKYQLVVRSVREDGVGRLQRAFEELKQRLAAEGLFAAERKQALPPRPRTVGFVTSPTGAALRDFVSILRRRTWTGTLRVLPVRVQGVEAAAEIATMIRLAGQEQLCDLLVVGRGGGSLEDLWPFNEEVVVRAIVACPIPVISAVGHEIDFTLSDFAADWRAETPSAAAEKISSAYLDLVDRVAGLAESLGRAADDRLLECRRDLELVRHRLAAQSPTQRLERAWLRFDELAHRLEQARRRSLEERRLRAERLGRRLAAATPAHRLNLLRERLRGLSLRLDSAGPEAPLRRGFALVRAPDGTPLASAAEAAAQARLQLRFRDGELTVRAGE